jgi:triacylglycerol lipase
MPKLKIIFIALMAITTLPNPIQAREAVILLHGLCRTSHSMARMANALSEAGYDVHNVNYPSRTAKIETLAENAIAPAVKNCLDVGDEKINFVTHSLGGILVRDYLKRNSIPNLGRVVMLAPPNQGSEVIDHLKNWRLFKMLNGPAGQELGTDKNSVPNQLGAANFCVGIIAGNLSINWINSLFFIRGRDDGKVSVERSKLAGMSDHITIAATHPFIMKNRDAIRQTIYFLRAGKFLRDA